VEPQAICYLLEWHRKAGLLFPLLRKILDFLPKKVTSEPRGSPWDHLLADLCLILSFASEMLGRTWGSLLVNIYGSFLPDLPNSATLLLCLWTPKHR
jgi:hypothetical protein